MTAESDSVLRAITRDGAFRVITTSTSHTVREVVELQRARATTAEYLAELVTGTILVRETMAPQLRVQGILRGANSGTLVADSHPDGTSRGLANMKDGAVTLGPGAMLQVMRTLPAGQIHQGVVEVSHSRGISDAFMTYMQTSEQVTCLIAVGALMRDDHVAVSGGYMVQLLPEADRSMLMIMTERLEAFDPIHELLKGDGISPRELTSELLHGMPYVELEESPLRFSCNCSHVRVVAGLSTLRRSEIEELMRGGEALHISCDFCGKEYQVAPEQLRGLLQQS